MDVLAAHVCAPCVCPQWPEEGVGVSGTGVMDGYELLCQFWESSLGLQ